MKNLREWLDSAMYLPPFIRDFHDQKELFKRIDQLKSSGNMFEKPNWVTAQIYVIDFFLFFMARHGYTLQKSKAKIDFESLDKTMHDFRDEKFGYLKQIIASKEDTTNG